jgi:hypothetical protein
MTDTTGSLVSGAQTWLDTLTSNSVVRDVGNFTEGFFGKKPLFSNGTQIGNWSLGGSYFDLNKADNLAPLCSGQVALFSGVTADQMDPSTWQTYDDWGGLINVDSYCAQAGLSSNGAVAGPASYDYTPLYIAGGLVLLSIMIAVRHR